MILKICIFFGEKQALISLFLCQKLKPGCTSKMFPDSVKSLAFNLKLFCWGGEADDIPSIGIDQSINNQVKFIFSLDTRYAFILQ